MTYFWRVFNAWSQLLNTMCGGEPNESISGRAFRQGWGMRHLINAAFFWQADHCEAAHRNERLACIDYLMRPVRYDAEPARSWWRRMATDAAIVATIAGALTALLLLAGCADAAPAAPRADAQAGAAAAATRAAQAVSAADAAAADAARAEGQAAGAELWAQIDPVPERIRAAAEARIQAASARAVADALRRHADQADAAAQAAIERARAEREAEARALAEREAQADRERTRVVAGLVVAGCVAVAGLLLWLKLKSLLIIPGVVAAGALALAAWSSVPWLPAALGLAMAVAILGGLALALRTAIREWRDYADGLGRAMPEAKAAHDDASLGRQSRPARWLISNLLGAP